MAGSGYAARLMYLKKDREADAGKKCSSSCLRGIYKLDMRERPYRNEEKKCTN